MAQEDFDRLLDGICSIKNTARKKDQSDALHLSVNGVQFTLAPAPNNAGDIDALGYFCNFGPLPEELPHAPILRRLLESNLFLFGADLPRFTCNPETGSVLLVGRLALTLVTGEIVIQLLDQMSDYARQWGETYFLEDVERSSYSEPVRFNGSTATRSILPRPQHTS